MKRLGICLCSILVTFGCVSHQESLRKKVYLANTWKVINTSQHRNILDKDTLKLIACDFCRIEDPVNLKPTFIFNRRKLFNRKDTRYTNYKQDFIMSINPTSDTLWTDYPIDVSGKWRLRKKNTRLVLKHLSDKGSPGLISKKKAIYTLTVLGKDTMVLVKQ